MKKNRLKLMMLLSTLGFFMLGLGLTETYAQRRVRKVPAKKVVVTGSVQQYKNLPRRGVRVAVLPQNTVIIRRGKYHYHYHNGIFYRPLGGTFVVVAPPVGIRVSVLPPNPVRVRLSGRSYFYYNGTYYVPASSGDYVVVAPPEGAQVDALPDGYEEIELDGRIYYRLDETYYKAVVEANGNVVYEVIRV